MKHVLCVENSIPLDEEATQVNRPNRGKTVFLRVSARLGKEWIGSATMTPFHGQREGREGECQHIACWYTCVSNPHLCIYGKKKNATEVSTDSRILAANVACDVCVCVCVSHPTPRLVNVIRLRAKSRDGKERREREETKQEETADISTISSWFGFASVFFFFHYLIEKGGRRRRRRRRRGQKCLSKWKIATFPPTTPTVITSIPLPPALPDVLTRRNGLMHRTVWLIRMNWSV